MGGPPMLSIKPSNLQIGVCAKALISPPYSDPEWRLMESAMTAAFNIFELKQRGFIYHCLSLHENYLKVSEK